MTIFQNFMVEISKTISNFELKPTYFESPHQDACISLFKNRIDSKFEFWVNFL